jgi:hypothetical protein
MKKLIKNYTTDIAVEKTIAEIQKILSENGAIGIAQDYNDGIITALFFRIQLGEKTLVYRMPAKTEKVYEKLFKNKPQTYRYKEQHIKKSSQIAWRICKTWLEAQITFINLEQAQIEEIMLPYLLVGDNKTLYDEMKNNQFSLPQLPE